MTSPRASVPGPPTVDVHLGPDEWRAALRADVAAGLRMTPKTLPPKWLYDERGSDLFDRITLLPEYYPTRTERQIIEDHVAEIVKLAGADTFVELGSGTSTKTQLLLQAATDDGSLRRFVPFDVSEATLRAASTSIARQFPGLSVHAVVGDFERHLHLLPAGGPKMVLFLGSTIGNFVPAARARFLSQLRASLAPGDSLLLGTDLVKEGARLVAAYDDAAGVTAAFNRNVLAVVNRELGADFDLEAFDHVALWDPANEWIEMRLRARRAQAVAVRDLDLTVRFATGEELHTEISAKFRRDGVEQELSDAGLELTQWWTDEQGDFALSLSTAV